MRHRIYLVMITLCLMSLAGCAAPAASPATPSDEAGGSADEIKFPGSHNRGEMVTIYESTSEPTTEATAVLTVPPPLPTIAPTTVSVSPVRVQNPTAVPTAIPEIAPTAVSPRELAPKIEVFDLSASSIRPGGTVTVRWKTTAAVTFMLEAANSTALLGTWSDQPAEGTLDIAIPASAQKSVTLVMIAGDVQSSTPPSIMRKSITLSCSTEWFFANPPFECPQPARMWRGVAQYFENGFMIWIPAQGSGLPLIKVFYYSGRLEQVGDDWQEGMPESDPSLVPPDGWHQPVRGFGQLWRLGNRRETLGWATSKEFEFGGATQKWVSALDAIPTTYELTPSGVLRLNFDNFWIVWPTN